MYFELQHELNLFHLITFNFDEDYVCLSVKGEVIDGVFVPEDNYKNLIDMSLQDKKIQDLFEERKDYTLKVRNKKTDPSQEGTYIETSGFSGWFYAHKSPGNKRTICKLFFHRRKWKRLHYDRC